MSIPSEPWEMVWILCTTNKGNHTNTVEKYYFYKETKNGTQINDRNAVTERELFKVLVQHEVVVYGWCHIPMQNNKATSLPDV
jgi:hypothetical protein